MATKFSTTLQFTTKYSTSTMFNRCQRANCSLYAAAPTIEAKADYDKNGRIYTNKGKFVRDILLGDGIQTVQATSEGVIWTSYFDEGIFGNYGWDNPLGSSGLVAWDAQETGCTSLRQNAD